MADLTNLTPDDVKNLSELAKIAGSADPLIAKIVGGLVSISGAVLIILTHINNLRTKKNTEAQETTTKMLEKHKVEMTTLKNEAVTSVKELVTDFHSTVEFTQNQLNAQVDDVKKVVAKVNGFADQKLGMIPRLQDAVDALEKRILDVSIKASKTDLKVDEIFTVIKKAKDGS